MEVAVRELKNHLSKYLRRAEAGEEIVVTSHGRRIVRMTGVLSGTPEAVEADAVVRLRDQPWVRSGSGEKVEGAEHPIPGVRGEQTLSDLLLEDRD